MAEGWGYQNAIFLEDPPDFQKGLSRINHTVKGIRTYRNLKLCGLEFKAIGTLDRKIYIFYTVFEGLILGEFDHLRGEIYGLDPTRFSCEFYGYETGACGYLKDVFGSIRVIYDTLNKGRIIPRKPQGNPIVPLCYSIPEFFIFTLDVHLYYLTACLFS